MTRKHPSADSPYYPQPKGTGPEGRPLCRWCWQEVPRGRRSWCGDECLEEYFVETDPGRRRDAIWERDHGVCALCSTDTGLQERTRQRCRRLSWEAYKFLVVWMQSIGFNRGAGHLWEADHITPQSEGGGHTKGNLRTLCIPCHKGETGKLRKRLAARNNSHRDGQRGQLRLD